MTVEPYEITILSSFVHCADLEAKALSSSEPIECSDLGFYALVPMKSKQTSLKKWLIPGREKVQDGLVPESKQVLKE